MPKITGLPQDSSPSTDDYTITVDTTSGQAKKVLLSDLYTMMLNSLNSGSGLTSGAIDWTNGDIWWQEIARTTLSSSGDTITVSSIPEKNYYKFLFYAKATGGVLDTFIKFNNDGGSNYAYTHSNNFAAAVSSTSQVQIPFEGGQTDSGQLLSGYIDILTNTSSQEKSGNWKSVSQDAAGAGTGPSMLDGTFKWANTSSVINRIDWTNTGAGSFDIGSEVIVLGHD